MFGSLLGGAVGRYKERYKNYLSVMLAVKGNAFPIKAIEAKTGNELLFQSKAELTADIYGMRYDGQTKIVTLQNGLRFYDGIDNGNLYQIFNDEDYSFLLPVQDLTVIDIGANIADSSIYFALKGAKSVIALEPFKNNYETAKRNVSMNHMEDRINLVNSGISGQSKEIIVSAAEKGVYSQVIEKAEGNKIELQSLGDLLKNYNLKDGLVLKLDCEGCEYDAIRSQSSDVLQKFSKIQIEYHYGYERLKNHLEMNGFKVKVTEPKEKNGMQVGWLYATKTDS